MSDAQDRIARLAAEAQQRADRGSGYSVGYYEGSRCALFQAAEDLRALLDADEPEEGGDE